MPTIGEIYLDDYVKRRTEPLEARIAELETALREAEMHLGGYMGSRFADVAILRSRVRALLGIEAI